MIKIDVKTTHHKKVTKIYQYLAYFLNFQRSHWKLKCFPTFIYHKYFVSQNSVVTISKISEWLLFNANTAIFSYVMGEQVNFQWNDDEVHFALDQHA
jgi:hypothetical protein